MDRVFKKRSYTLSVIVTLVFTGILAATAVDNTSCPLLWQLVIESYNSSGGADGSQTHPLMAIVPSSIFDSLYRYFPCNTIDLLLHVYIIWFLLFMIHKWVIYKRAGWHYFMLDYCYFHNMNFIFFLLFILVQVDVRPSATDGSDLVGTTWGSAVLRHAHNATHDSSPMESLPGVPHRNLWTAVGRGLAAITRPDADRNALIHAARWYGVDVIIRGSLVPFMVRFGWWDMAARVEQQVVPYSTFRTPPNSAPAQLSTRIVVQPLREAVLDLSPSQQEGVTILFLLFLTGSLGPILGAILMWKNALLFHSIDKMTACFLHLAPALVQLAIMDSVLTSLELRSFSVTWLAQGVSAAHTAVQGAEASEGFHTADLIKGIASRLGAPVHNFSLAHLPQWLLAGALAEEPSEPDDIAALFSRYLTYPNWIALHLCIFLLWQLFYHSTYEALAVRRHIAGRIRSAQAERRRLKEERRRQRMGEAPPPPDVLSNCGTNPIERVTAYTYMLEHPPLGRGGPLDRAVHLFGNSVLATKFMFNLLQWFIHVIFLTLSYLLIALCRLLLTPDVTQRERGHAAILRRELTFGKKTILVLAAYVLFYVCFAIWNSSVIMKKWIQKLQEAADAADHSYDDNARAKSKPMTPTNETAASKAAKAKVGKIN